MCSLKSIWPSPDLPGARIRNTPYVHQPKSCTSCPNHQPSNNSGTCRKGSAQLRILHTNSIARRPWRWRDGLPSQRDTVSASLRIDVFHALGQKVPKWMKLHRWSTYYKVDRPRPRIGSNRWKLRKFQTGTARSHIRSSCRNYSKWAMKLFCRLLAHGRKGEVWDTWICRLHSR